MSLAINNNSNYINFNNEKQRNRAVNYVNKNDGEITNLAVRHTALKNHKKNEKLAKNINLAFNSLPFVALASGLATKKGLKSSLKDAVQWGLAVAIPSVINKPAKKSSAKNKNSDMSFGLKFGLSFVSFIAASSLVNQAAKDPKVNKVFDNAISTAKTKLNDAAAYCSKPIAKLSSLKSKFKIPETVKNVCADAMNTPIAKSILPKAKNISKSIVKNAPILIALGTFVTIIGTNVKQSFEISNTKKMIKNNQLDVARNLIDNYKQENADLKSAAES